VQEFWNVVNLCQLLFFWGQKLTNLHQPSLSSSPSHTQIQQPRLFERPLALASNDNSWGVSPSSSLFQRGKHWKTTKKIVNDGTTKSQRYLSEAIAIGIRPRLGCSDGLYHGVWDALFAPRLLRPFGSVPTFVSPNEDHFGGSPVLENAKSRNVPTKISFSHTHCRHLHQGSSQPIGSLNWDHLSGSKMDLSETTQIKATETAPKNRLRNMSRHSHS
jgi:hypothetical protein